MMYSSFQRNDVNFVVTEYGVAQLKGKTLKERAKALILISHPRFRPHLMLEYKKRFNEDVFTKEELKAQMDEIKENIESTVGEFREKLRSDLKKIVSAE